MSAPQASLDGLSKAACLVGASNHALTRVQPSYRMLIHHDGAFYVADVPELSGCKGIGSSYAEAVQNAENAIGDWLRSACATGQAPPFLLNATNLMRKLKQCVAEPDQNGHRHRPVSLAKQRLIDKFGKISNRKLAACIGLIERDAPLNLSAAASGKGTRKVRCAIAFALDVLPSSLWPDRPAANCQDDDASYLALRQSKLDGGFN